MVITIKIIFFVFVPMLFGCSLLTSDEPEKQLVIQSSGRTGIELERREKTFLFTYDFRECYSGVAVTKKEEIEIDKEALCSPERRSWLGKFIQFFGEFLGGLAVGFLVN